ncbi:RYamide neuropeptides [Toxorhynchites rutilus septentrionalis]|uniref:RYamide neuropeptides n=1 Tax=Toxorhynchites rutilus septentrionalis TaxID=329112 RepID=UPI00247B159C|nr:RYamide neuropeptides [Toxorhynchites rutilus septentrionalis]
MIKLITRYQPASVYTALLALLSMVILAHVCDADPSFASNSLFADDDKHVDEKRPFFVGSRYGRSHVYGGKDLRQVNVVPRNDRFFLGSRYGKRSDPLNKEIETDNNNGAELTYLACLHTGVSNLYRCYGKDREIPVSGQTILQNNDSLDLTVK